MPVKRRPGGGGGSRAALIAKRACEVEDPLASIPTEQLLLRASRQPRSSRQKPSPDAACGGTSLSSTITTAGGTEASTAVQTVQSTADVAAAGMRDDQGAGPEPPRGPEPEPEPGTSVVLQFRHLRAAQVSPALQEWALRLVRDSLRGMYEPVWGWSDVKKRAQLEGAASRFLLATAEGPASDGAIAEGTGADGNVPDGIPAAYINFRLEPYNGQPVCYLYEVMVAEAYRRLGLGVHLMQLVERMAWDLGMDRCVLTEFTANKAAEAFYRKCGYSVDPTSPGGAAGYVILSKARPKA